MDPENITDSIGITANEFLSFSWADYALFILMFGFSALIGIYYGCFGNKQSTTEEYLHGGKKMSVFPIAMSLAASNLSGISLLGIPAEVYINGSQYSMCAISAVLLVLIVSNIFLPVFYKLQLTSAYEYLERRFSHKIRLVASALFVLTTLLYIPIVIYVPALAFNQVTGIDLYLITPIVSFVCIFYTTIGGLKAVVWTDTLQFTVTLLTLGFVLVVGTISVGGFAAVWEKSALGNRLEFFKMDPNPMLRESFWSVVIGQTVLWMAHFGCNPATVQRFISLPTLQGAKRSLIIFAIATIITKLIICFSGLIMFAKYYECDPISSKKISKSDQILPYYVLDVANTIPGLSGLFVAGVFSTAFSTLSTFLNTLSGIIYTDFIKPFLPIKTSDAKANNIMKANVVILGTTCIGLVFVVDKLGAVLELNLSVAGITLGPLLALFMLGMLFPIANEKGAICGSLSSTLIMAWIVIQNKLSNYRSANKAFPKPLNTFGCGEGFNVTNATILPETSSTTLLPPSHAEEESFWLFRITFYYYPVIGAVLAIVIGLIVSWFTHDNLNPVDPDLLCPYVHRFLEKSAKTAKYTSVEKGLHITMERNACEKIERTY